MKKAWDIISTVLVWLIVIVAVFMMIFTIVSVNTFDRNDRKIFGHKAFIVLSNSMEPKFSAGDLVVVKDVPMDKMSELKVGDVIAFQSLNQEAGSYGKTVSHEIYEVVKADDGRLMGFRTKGINTGNKDTELVTPDYVRGKYAFHLAKVGHFFDFLKSTPGYIVCILIPFLLLIGYQGLNCVKIFKLYKKEQMEELQAEKDAIESERKKNEEMMAELMALKAQMEAQNTKPAEKTQEEPQAEQPAEEETEEEPKEETETSEEPKKEED